MRNNWCIHIFLFLRTWSFFCDWLHVQGKKRERKKKRSFNFDIFPRSSSLPTRIILWCSPKCVVVSLTACALLLRRLAVYHTMLSGSLCVSPGAPINLFFFLIRYIFFFLFFSSFFFSMRALCVPCIESVAIWVHGDRSRRWTNSLFRSIRLVYL